MPYFNALELGEGRAFEISQLGLSTNVVRSTNVQLLPSAPLLPNPCYVLPFFRHSGCVVFNVSRKVRKPKSPAVNEEIKITNFELLIIGSFSNASKDTKIDIVNPIPAKSPTPNIDFHFKSVGSLQNPNVTAKNVKIKMPKGLPTISPSAIPKLLFSIRVCAMSPLKTMAVFANAKIGKMINATGLCKKCCKINEVDFSSPLPNGMTNANNTPVIVA